MYWLRKTHSDRESGCFPCHFRRMPTSDVVGSCWRSATSRRKSSRSSLADSSKILATSDVDTDSPRPLERICLERSRNSRSVSEIRIDSVCCCGFRSTAPILPRNSASMQDCASMHLYRYKLELISAEREGPMFDDRFVSALATELAAKLIPQIEQGQSKQR